MQPTVWTVALSALITAVATGLGAVPFFFLKDLEDRWIGVANAVASGLMLGASVGLLREGATYSIPRLLLGAAVGVLFIIVSRRLLSEREELEVGALEGADALKALLILGVMTAHSFAEGVGVGVSYGDGQALGSVITGAIAVHNIPEGLAISLVLVPRGTPVWRAALWSIFSSLPQPITAIPAFLFVLTFREWLPAGLGFAAGAMLYMVLAELIPDAREDASDPVVAGVTAVTFAAMLAFTLLLGG